MRCAMRAGCPACLLCPPLPALSACLPVCLPHSLQSAPTWESLELLQQRWPAGACGSKVCGVCAPFVSVCVHACMPASRDAPARAAPLLLPAAMKSLRSLSHRRPATFCLGRVVALRAGLDACGMGPTSSRRSIRTALAVYCSPVSTASERVLTTPRLCSVLNVVLLVPPVEVRTVLCCVACICASACRMCVHVQGC
jgi:hypothetical protein